LFLQLAAFGAGDVDVLGTQIHVPEQVVVHEAVITLRMGTWQLAVLIQIEGLHFLERNLTRPEAFHQILIGAQWGAASSQPEGACRPGPNQLNNYSASGSTELGVIFDTN